MAVIDWDNIQSNIFTVAGIENKVNADKLFTSLLLEIEKNGIDIYKDFTIAEIAELIPRGAAGVNNYSTYGFSIMSMLSGQKYRDYFVFENKNLRDEFTTICNNIDRDNYIWRKIYLNERAKINPKYIKEGKRIMGKAGDNEKAFIDYFSEVFGENILKGKRVFKSKEDSVEISVDNFIYHLGKQLLIEIDSGNMAKLIVGQYVLLNELCDIKEEVLFLVIHLYKDKNGKQYNPGRTISNLKFINKKVYANKGIRFRVFNKDGFEELCKENKDINSLLKSLYE